MVKPITGVQMGFDAAEAGLDFALLSEMAAEGGIEFTQATVSLAERFGVPPFSVLDARQGYWQDRKRAWVSLGIKSELGRGEGIGTRRVPGSPDPAPRVGGNYVAIGDKDGGIKSGGYALKGQRPGGKGYGRAFAQDLMRGEHVVGSSRHAADQRSNVTGAPPKPEWATGTGTANMAPGTSIFDPVLCEIAYRWFCPAGASATVLDPFAGGSVRGVVAAYLGHQYLGIDLRPEQVTANEEQWIELVAKLAPSGALNRDELLNQYPAPEWAVGDARDVAQLAQGRTFDFLFTCPPYFDLEVYSDDPADLSNCADYAAFTYAYNAIIEQSLKLLRPGRFACFVVGDLRDDEGFYRNLPGDTIGAFTRLGAHLLNEAILLTAIGSLPIRVAGQFRRARKLGKTHQKLLVFFKGSAKQIKDLGEVMIDLPMPSVGDPLHYREEAVPVAADGDGGG